MAAIGRFDTTGPADFPRARTAALIDAATAMVLTIVAYPFPIARATLSRPLFVGSILASLVIGHVLYLMVVLIIWGRTPGMYLLDLGLEGGRPRIARAALWGMGASLAFWPTVATSGAGDPAVGLPARFSGLPTLSTGAPDNDGSEDSR